MSSKFRQVSFEEAAVTVTAAVAAVGPAPEGEGRQPWLHRVADLARDLGDVIKEVRVDLMRVVKVIPVEGVLEIPAAQNNANRINYVINSGRKIKDSLWTEFLRGGELEQERARLEALRGRRVRLTKVTTIEFGSDGEPKLDNNGEPEQRSFARGPIAVVDGISAVGEGRGGDQRIAVNDAKRRLLKACRAAVGEDAATDVARRLFSELSVDDGSVRDEDLRTAEAEAGRRAGRPGRLMGSHPRPVA